MSAESTTTGVGFQLTITNVTGLHDDYDSRQNVKKRIGNILYLHSPPPDSVLLAYAGSKEITAVNSLYIGDRSDRLYPNSRNSSVSEFMYYYTPVTVQHKNILVTAKFAVSSASDMPLYYKHLLDSTVQIDTVKILDKNFKDIASDQYIVEPIFEYDETTGNIVTPKNILSISVYNNLENSYNEETGECIVYYLQYRDTNNNTLTVLLNNEVSYHEATISDIWSVSGELKPWSTAYIINNNYSLSVPRSLSSDRTKFSIKYTANSKMYVEHPVLSSNTSLWIPRIANGSFLWSYSNEPYLYDIPEFKNQSFNPIEPYKLAAQVESMKIGKYLIKLPHEDIAIGGIFQYFSILIYKNNQLEYALTEDLSLIGSRYKDLDGRYITNTDGDIVEWSNSEIISIDRRSGIIQLSIELKDTWSYKATYNYKEIFYELSSLNMNPIYNNEVHKQIKVIYIVPKARANFNSGRQSASVNFITVAPNGIIETTSQNGLSDGDPSLSYDFPTRLFNINGIKITGHIGLHYSWKASTYLAETAVIDTSQSIAVESTENFPRDGWIRIKDDNGKWRYMKYIDKTRGSATTNPTLVLSSGLDKEGNAVSEVPVSLSITYDSNNKKIVELVNFLDEYTTSSTRDPNTERISYDNTGFPNCFNRYFVLADMTINPPHGVNEVTLLDTRREGGCINLEKYEEAKSIQPEAQWYFDYMKYDGQPYPGKAAIVIKLPNELLNTFTEDQIEEIINNNIPFGVKPLIRYYGYKPRIISVTAIKEDGFGNNYFGDHYFGEE
jgi:hypothetical protein